MRLTVGSVFSGIGGIELGLEWAGMDVCWQVERNRFCTEVLERRWPDVERYREIRRCVNMPKVDVICGGWPCQPFSVAGKRRGENDRRDMWPEFRRLICEVRPRWVVAENVTEVRRIGEGRYFGGILRDLAEIGYDAEWDCIPASVVGAPHQRDRVWLVAYPASVGVERGGAAREYESRVQTGPVIFRRGGTGIRAADWEAEPGVDRMVDGASDWVDRLRVLGNGAVPQIAEWIGGRIIENEDRRRKAPA